MQVYCDFSGYSDIAIGVAALLGYRFKWNFDRPLAATSLQDLWQRWHISLTSWLRDYLYRPLKGNRRGQGRIHLNLTITMLGTDNGKPRKVVIFRPGDYETPCKS